ncbi:MAG: LLM class flavin-dependent oxidoreductase [Actinobacteria bacterium]|nr:LLM class flavin-dependent oxidoreductase [Actinomycetota bacterium]
MRFLIEPVEARSLDHVLRLAEATHAAGLDGVLLTASETLPAPLVVAAAVAARVPDTRLAALVDGGDRHPIQLAEEAAVVDVASGGRVILAVRPAPGREDVYGEVLDLLRLSFAARPFRFEGRHWTVPAGLDQNVHNPERRVRVTPAPAQARLELWVAGGGREQAFPRGLGYLADTSEDDADLQRAWQDAATAPASLGAPRARREHWTDAPTLLARLRAARGAWDQDWAAVAAPVEALREIASVVRPRVQLDRLPPGLEEFWDETEPWRLAGDTPPAGG